MVSSKNSSQHIKPVRIPPALRGRLERLRHTGHAGTQIQMHRGLVSLPVGTKNILTALILTLVVVAAWALVLEPMLNVWHALVAWWIDALQLNSPVLMKDYAIGSLFKLGIPYIDIIAGAPSCMLWAITTIITALIFKFPINNIPFRYLLKAVAFIQLCASFYFLMYPNDFPHMLDNYFFGMLTAGLILISIIPILFAFTYFIFDFTLQQKLFITILTMLYLCLFIPLQYLLHVYIIYEASLLFLPVLFFIFGLPLDILAIIALYSWAISWKVKTKADIEIYQTANPTEAAGLKEKEI